MADAWHALQQAARALRKDGSIRLRLAEAYRSLAKLKSKDYPHEVREDYEWLQAHLHSPTVHCTLTDITETVANLSQTQLSEAVRRIAALHDAVAQYQPTVPRTPRQAACRAVTYAAKEEKTQLELWDNY